jgi:hypothetical protein
VYKVTICFVQTTSNNQDSTFGHQIDKATPEPNQELQSVTKGPALVDMRLIIAKIKKLGSPLDFQCYSSADAHFIIYIYI